ncbi:putative enoyl-CoA hydratase echA8 [bacterium HR24]|jgi:enoyl-CoA hydratase/carnithine racemase|nr:putative enoyl-CoA hydratase echA8 [bacterium HR24]
MAYQEVTVEKRGRVGIVTLNRPHRLNSLGRPMTDEMRQALEEFNRDPEVGAIVLTGTGRAFCSGADFESFRAVAEGGERFGVSGLANWVGFVQQSKPIVCAINGYAVGAGLTLTLPCDVRIASDQARLSMRFVRLGLLPELASTKLLAHIVGLTNALEMMLTGRFVEAEEAYHMGLVNKVVPHDRLLDAAVEKAAEIAFNPDECLAAVKRLVWANLTEPDLEAVQRREMSEFATALQGDAFREAVRAFFEKREPRFHG